MAGDWEGGEREGFPWRRLGLVVLVAALVAGAVLGTRGTRELPVDTSDEAVEGGSERVEVVVAGPLQAGDRWYCPPANPIRTFDNGFYYPPGYPEALGHLGRPDACYADAQRAERADFQRAPPPAGFVVAGGIYIGPAASPTLAACAQVAEHANGLAVPCPTMLPAPGNGPSCAAPAQCMFELDVIIEQRGFPAPPQWCDGCETHVVVAAEPNGRSGPLVTCEQGVDLPDLPPRPGILLLECPEDQPPWVPGLGGYPHAGHTMTAWHRGDTTYAASVEGFGQPQREVLAVVVDGIEYVSPGKSEQAG